MLCIMYVIIFEAAADSFSERGVVVKTSSIVQASRKYYCVLCMLFFDRHQYCDIQMMWVGKQMDCKVIDINFLAGK